ncbi:MAG: cytochrome c oxidase accessory protein CcoG [Myxococcota bacterium]
MRYKDNVLTTLRSDGSRIWMRPKLSPGWYLNRRRVVGYGLIVLFLVLPFVQVGGHPAILLDVMERRFYLFGLTFHPTDSVLLMFLMLSIFLGIFWVTALFGRVWCGWGCPQTVYMELLFRPLERLFEGGVGMQRRIDQQGISGRRLLKYGVFLVIAFVLGNQFLAYFVGWSRLAQWMTEPPTRHMGGFAVMAVTTGLVFFDFAYFREQMCTVICPYARLQSALLDRNSLIVGYDAPRGETRRRLKARSADDGSGDCIDCRACVTTCPTGIDIREGLQLECINCAQCIDACDAIMTKIGRPKGLIRLSSQTNLQTGRPTKWWRARVVVYPVIIAALLAALVGMIVAKAPADVTVLRQLAAPYTILDDGSVRNQLRIKVVNRTGQPHTYSIDIEEAAGLEVLAPQFPLTVQGRDFVTTPVFVTTDREAFRSGQREVVIRIEDSAGFSVERNYLLLGPK